MSEPTRTISPERADTATVAPASDAGETRTSSGGESGSEQRPDEPQGYQLLEEIGRGGMGVVYRARDQALNREVAVKILQDKYGPSSGTAVRFVEEARITGQLQHPGIPAIYQVGALPDGRPFLAMKLIKGETLDAILKSKSPVDALGVFEGISQAVGYAHAHGVIHRDLKPANVMVGSFGEVQVMDWGLAKVISPGQTTKQSDSAEPQVTAAATEIRSLRDSDGSFTQAGSILGTPAFMPPEQAAGELNKIDTRSDVFGLGAILCVLLTGQPPFDGKDSDSVRLNAVRGKTEAAFARLDASGADPDVIALCKRCLSFEPDDRPKTANDVATAVAALRRAADDRAKQAERDKLSAEVRAAEQAKRRKAGLWATGVVFTVLAAGIVGTTAGLLRADAHAKAADEAREQADQAREQAELKRKEAEEKRQEAEKARIAEEIAKKNADEKRKEAENARAAEEIAKKNALEAKNTAELRQKDAERAREVTTQQRRLALDTVRDVLLRVDDLMKNDAKLAPLRIEIIRRMLEDVDRIRDHAKKNPLEDRTEAVAYNRLGEVYFKSNRIEDALMWYRKSYVALGTLNKDTPNDTNAMRNLAASASSLAEAEWRFGNGPRSHELRIQALELRQKRLTIVQNTPNIDEIELRSAEMDVADSLQFLAYDELRMGNPVIARDHYLMADKAYAALGVPLANTIRVRRYRCEIKVRLADTAARLERLDEAEKLFREALADREAMAKLVTRPAMTAALIKTDIGQSQMYIGDFLMMFRKDRAAAAIEYTACRDLFAAQLKDDPDNLDLRQRLAASYYRLGVTETDPAKAQAAFTESLKLREELAKPDPKDMTAAVELALSYARLGKETEAERTIDSLLRQGRKDPQVLFQTACALSILAGTSKDEKAADRYRDRAFQVAQEAAKAGWKDRGAFDGDPDFDFIRGDPRYSELFKSLPAPPTTAPPPRPKPEN